MIDYRKLGFVSAKQHTICEFEGKMLAEHVITRDGFNEQYSILELITELHNYLLELYLNDKIKIYAIW